MSYIHAMKHDHMCPTPPGALQISTHPPPNFTAFLFACNLSAQLVLSVCTWVRSHPLGHGNLPVAMASKRRILPLPEALHRPQHLRKGWGLRPANPGIAGYWIFGLVQSGVVWYRCPQLPLCSLAW